MAVGSIPVGVSDEHLLGLGRRVHHDLQRPETQTTVVVIYPEVMKRAATMRAIFERIHTEVSAWCARLCVCVV